MFLWLTNDYSYKETNKLLLIWKSLDGTTACVTKCLMVVPDRNSSNLFRLLGRECNPAVLANALHHPGATDDQGIQQSKDAIIYVTVSKVKIFKLSKLIAG